VETFASLSCTPNLSACLAAAVTLRRRRGAASGRVKGAYFRIASNAKRIYILTNEAMPGLVKIGFTTGENVESRIAPLSGATGIPLPFECYFAAEVEVKDCDKLEKRPGKYRHRRMNVLSIDGGGVKPELR